MNNIDILEKLKNKQYTNKDILGNLVLSEEEYTAITTLIAENKELKERNKRQQENLKITNKKIAAQRGQLMMLNKAYIPKSKVEAKIEQLDYNDIGNFERRCKQEVLQELLGKE